jgi:hypothetical protein
MTITASPLLRAICEARRLFAFCLLAAILPASLSVPSPVRAETEEASESEYDGGLADLPASLEEARSRARWMAELINGSLQIMHRDFFDANDPNILPSQSLEDVFREMARTWSVEIRWLGVNATKGKKHRPADDFERSAVSALRAGAPEYHEIEDGRFRFVKSIRIQNECLKCHVPYRTSLEDRIGGIAFSFPFLAEPLSTTSLEATESAATDAGGSR